MSKLCLFVVKFKNSIKHKEYILCEFSTMAKKGIVDINRNQKNVDQIKFKKKIYNCLVSLKYSSL